MENFIHWSPNPIFFSIPFINWPVRWYGISWALAFILSSFIMGKIFETEKRKASQLDSLTFYLVIATLVGARLGHCLFYDADRYLSHPLEILKIYEGGLASHGAAIGIIIGMWLYCRKFKENLMWLFDRIVVVVPLASASIRFGNFMNSEIIGKITNVPWAIVFTQVDQNPRHPAQLYECIYCLVLFGITYYLWKKKRNELKPGFLFGFYLAVMFTFRFVVEFLKENQSPFENEMTLNMGQILSIPFVALGIYMMVRAVKNTKVQQKTR